MSEKVASLKDRVLDLLKEIGEDTELALAPEIAQVQAGLNSAHKWLENLSNQPPAEAPVPLEESTPVSEIPGGEPSTDPAPEQPPVDNDHVAEGSEKFGE
jgi:hypothetical protein